MCAAGLNVIAPWDELLGQADVVVDCTPKRIAAKNVEVYRHRGLKFILQGGEKHSATGHSFVAESNYSSAAVEAGDVVLVRSDPRDVPRIIALSRASYRKMIQNLWWAAGYNIVAIPLAAGVLAPQGILLPPAFAAVLMLASTVIVALNAQLLRRSKL